MYTRKYFVVLFSFKGLNNNYFIITKAIIIVDSELDSCNDHYNNTMEFSADNNIIIVVAIVSGEIHPTWLVILLTHGLLL